MEYPQLKCYCTAIERTELKKCIKINSLMIEKMALKCFNYMVFALKKNGQLVGIMKGCFHSGRI